LVLSKRNQSRHSSAPLGNAELLAGCNAPKIYTQVLPKLANAYTVGLIHVAQCSTIRREAGRPERNVTDLIFHRSPDAAPRHRSGQPWSGSVAYSALLIRSRSSQGRAGS